MAPSVGSLVPTSWCSTYVLTRNTKEYLLKKFYSSWSGCDRLWLLNLVVSVASVQIKLVVEYLNKNLKEVVSDSKFTIVTKEININIPYETNYNGLFLRNYI